MILGAFAFYIAQALSFGRSCLLARSTSFSFFAFSFFFLFFPFFFSFFFSFFFPFYSFPPLLLHPP
ncbi:hypothetical protein DER46DRAFT_583859 [Fusarium sp. MPI-SDFR-AT-0072]|nr:hypothetical protein DER46DRAFT_583859 [Fusarium sp. MPI-SDFR-AT-0072]